ncbi:Uncharacterized protein Fot_23134 [Forsythia ovata]|uniref:Uncharacterized protein n=1 Tax=Forsythia ovata TaxID=205694 RepID=A0ABD1UZN7_9LAMI
MPRVISSSDSQENSSPSSNFSPESSGSHLSVDRPFGVVSRPSYWKQSADSSLGDGRLPPGSSRSTALLGSVDCSLWGMKFSLAGVLGSVPLATDDEGPSSPGQAKRRKT